LKGHNYEAIKTKEMFIFMGKARASEIFFYFGQLKVPFNVTLKVIYNIETSLNDWRPVRL